MKFPTIQDSAAGNGDSRDGLTFMPHRFIPYFHSLNDALKITGISLFVWAGVVLDWVGQWPWGVIIGAATSVWVAYVSRDARRRADKDKIQELQTEIATLSAHVAIMSHERGSKA